MPFDAIALPLSDPIVPVPRVSGPEQNGNTIVGIFTNLDESNKVTIEHLAIGGKSPQARRLRHHVRFDHTKVAIDETTGLPANTSPSVAIDVSLNRPLYGYSAVELKALVMAFIDWMDDEDVIEDLLNKQA